MTLRQSLARSAREHLDGSDQPAGADDRVVRPCGVLFDSTEWRRLDLASWSGTTAMYRVAEGFGRVREATFRKVRVVDGEIPDSVVYRALREEWETRP